MKTTIYEPREVEIAVTIPKLLAKIPVRRPFWERLLFHDDDLNYDLTGANLTICGTVTWPDGAVSRFESTLCGKASAPYVRTIKVVQK